MFMGLEMLTPLFASPEFLEMARHLDAAGRQVGEFQKSVGDAHEELAQLGFPPFARFAAGGVGGAPFDVVTSFLRGMKGSMLDMYRRPHKLIRACELILDRRIALAFPADPAGKDYPPRVGLPLWRGDPVFMSDDQFKKFYWPGLKKSLQTHVDLGYVPVPFFESKFGDRLECMRELPKGKVLASIEAADVVRAKELLGDHTSLLVRIPNTVRLWSLNQLESFIKDIIDKCGNKGLILVIKMPDKTRIEDMQFLIKSVKEYSRN
jgi:uroporphyrinogen-III decarboxylase